MWVHNWNVWKGRPNSPHPSTILAIQNIVKLQNKGKYIKTTVVKKIKEIKLQQKI
jgi:hypothetical protein